MQWFMCAIGAICALIAILELWKGAFSLLFGWVRQHERRVQFIFGITTLVLGLFYFARGDFSWAGDASVHVGYAWVAARSFAQGEFPIWTNFFSA